MSYEQDLESAVYAYLHRRPDIATPADDFLAGVEHGARTAIALTAALARDEQVKAYELIVALHRSGTE